jgi:nitroimidazol reductase NimA-like FMN-containing flavoprotein (pyridoxamine 5'-phosphate oxidase superfamily)
MDAPDSDSEAVGPAAQVRGILDANSYMTLATADADGNPWASPVFYAADGPHTLYWMSSPDTTHSRNLAARPELAIVVFDSTVPPGTGGGLYMSGTAGVVPDDELDEALRAFPGDPARGGRPVTADELRAPSPYRLYRATVTRHDLPCPRSTGAPCAEHGFAYDHRTTGVL